MPERKPYGRKRKGKSARWLEPMLLLAGFLCMGWVGWSLLETYFYQSYDSYRLDQAMRGQVASVAGFVRYTLGKGEPKKREGAVVSRGQEDVRIDLKPEAKPAPVGVIGRIDIPRLNVSAVVREGVDDRTLKHAVGHVPSTPLPGEPGNVGIAAHRDTFFRGLRNVRKGDKITLATPEGNYEYVVNGLKIVWPESTEVLDPTPHPSITLVTCYPFNYVGSAPKRFIVHAQQVQFEAAGERSSDKIADRLANVSP